MNYVFSPVTALYSLYSFMQPTGVICFHTYWESLQLKQTHTNHKIQQYYTKSEGHSVLLVWVPSFNIGRYAKNTWDMYVVLTHSLIVYTTPSEVLPRYIYTYTRVS